LEVSIGAFSGRGAAPIPLSDLDGAVHSQKPTPAMTPNAAVNIHRDGFKETPHEKPVAFL
jgi:hypothetical protein